MALLILFGVLQIERNPDTHFTFENTILVDEKDIQWNTHLLYWSHTAAAIMASINKFKLN